MGGGTSHTSDKKLSNIAVQSSALGLPIIVGWGTARVAPNLIWYDAFKATKHTKTSGGKGGGAKNTTYTYTASIIMGVCEGTILGIPTIYRDKSVFTDGGGTATAAGDKPGGILSEIFDQGSAFSGSTTALAQAGLSLATGDPNQAVWGYLTSMFPSQALNYSGIALIYAQDYPLDEGAVIPNHSLEVSFSTHVTALPDANPKDIVTDLLTNTNYGLPGWPGSSLGDYTDYGNYCLANNLLLSPLLDEQRAASDFLTELMMATNSDVFWSEGVLKIATYGDTAATGNGVTWTPNLSPQYDLTEDDFQDLLIPVQKSIVDQSDAYNIVQFEYLDRSNQYATAIEPAQDLANIFLYNKRKQDPQTVHCIKQASIAQTAVQLYLQRILYVRDIYKFRLPQDYARLEPMDYVSLTTTTDQLKLSRKLVRITQIDEDVSGILSMTAEGVDVGTAGAAVYANHSATSPIPDFSHDPGNVSTPFLLNAPSIMTGGEPELWIGASGSDPLWGGCEVWVSGDGVEYQKVGTITKPAKQGVLTATLPLGTNPDTTHTLSVNMAQSKQALSTATSINAASGQTLSAVGTELVTYQTATLTSADHYDLTTLQRGLYGSVIASHATSAPFCALDDSIFRFRYGNLAVGATLHVKLVSFNVFNRGLQEISLATDYTVSTTFDDLFSDWNLTSQNFNDRNDRLSTPVVAPVFARDGSDMNHTVSSDGSVTLNIAWGWPGSEADIDGFVVVVVQDAKSGFAGRQGGFPLAQSMVFG